MPDVMSVSARRDFEAWHTRQRLANVICDFQKELTEYRESDVKLLKQGCLSFKSVFEPLARFNPNSHHHRLCLQPGSPSEPHGS